MKAIGGPGVAESERYHALDAVRAFALLLGVVFHAAESFEGNAVDYWAVGDPSTSQVLEVFRHASHSFRLELFFVIAGFFARLLWLKRGVAGFVRNRVARILGPLVVGWLVLYPVLVTLWLTGASRTGRWEVVGVPPEHQGAPVWQLVLGFFASFGFVRKFDLTHLWFLYLLLVVYALALAVRAALGASGAGPAIGRALDRAFQALMTSPGRIPGLALLLLLPLLLQAGWSVDTPKNSLVPDLPVTALYSLFFGVGWGLHRQPVLLESCAGRWRGALAMGALLVLPTRYGLISLAADPAHAAWLPWIKAGHCALYGMMMVGFVLGFLGLFLACRRAESPGWRYVADASYWIYLVHLPLVVALQIPMAEWSAPWWIKFPFIVALATPVLFLSYHFLVRSTWVGAALNGRRYPRVWPWRA